MLPVGPRAPSEVPRREVLGPALRLEGPAVGVHAMGQERGQLSSPRGGVALASAPPTSSPHASGGGGVLPAAEATPPGRSAPARGSLPRPPAGAREGGVSSLPHFSGSEGRAVKAAAATAAPSCSAHDPKAHASALGHHVAPGVAVTEATGSVEISGAEGGGARVERLVLVKPAEGGRRRAKVKQGPAHSVAVGGSGDRFIMQTNSSFGAHSFKPFYSPVSQVHCGKRQAVEKLQNDSCTDGHIRQRHCTFGTGLRWKQ